MRSVVFLCACILLGAASVSAQTKKPISRKSPTRSVQTTTVKNCPASGLTDAEVADLLAEHNRQRQKVKTALLVWDCRLGAVAASWAARGTPGHSDTSFGENIFVSADPAEKVTKAPDRWEDEEHNWNNKAATCESGKTCTHFVQMVWRSTTKIGCAVNRQVSGKWKLMLVCNYDPEALGDTPAY
jgi:pathogenesis-related protein 1